MEAGVGPDAFWSRLTAWIPAAPIQTNVAKQSQTPCCMQPADSAAAGAKIAKEAIKTGAKDSCFFVVFSTA